MAKRERGKGRSQPFVFEWVCDDKSCTSAGKLHRKRIWAEDSERAAVIAKRLNVPIYSRVLRDDPDLLRLRILS